MRTAAAGLAPNDDQKVIYFTSLDELVLTSTQPRSSSADGEQGRRTVIPFVRRDAITLKGKHSLCVCHDYKGGYSEKNDERGYTFTWWHMIDKFIYFSHHRVSPPPQSWIRTAHRHGVKIFGTLVFEGETGSLDLLRLTQPSDPFNAPLHTPTAAGVTYANALIDLCLESQFDGWLVNVEVPFVDDQEPEQMQALLIWLRYFREGLRQKVGLHAEIMWYDGVNLLGVAWQNELNDFNSPFLEASDSIFLNYWWREAMIKSTSDYIQRNLQPSDRIYFGLDVWGRGQYGGGGFNSWLSLDLLDRVTGSVESLKEGPGYPVAIFAPGWTVESLDHTLTIREGHARWTLDDAHLWIGTETFSRPSRSLPTLKDQSSSIPTANETSTQLTRSEQASQPLASFRPLSAYVDNIHRAPPNLKGAFWTCFSQGSGHDFFIEGKSHTPFEAGWTDIDLTFPFPSLAIPSLLDDVKTGLIEEDAFLGPVSLKITSSAGGARKVPINSIQVAARRGQRFEAKVVWKALSPKATVKLNVCDGRGSYPLLSSDLVERHNGWQYTTADIQCDVDTIFTTLGVFLSAEATILIGSIAITPCVPTPPTTLRRLALKWSTSGRYIEWSPQTPSVTYAEDPHLLYVLWCGHEDVLLGVTLDRFFAVDKTALKARGVKQISIRQMDLDGTFFCVPSSLSI